MFGNLGRVPRPPFWSSKRAESFWTARSRRSGPGAYASPRGFSTAVTLAMAAVSSFACASTSSRRARYASLTAARIFEKPGMPYLSAGGKYVPPKNGLWSGVRNTVSGQPPFRPISCTTSW